MNAIKTGAVVSVLVLGAVACAPQRLRAQSTPPPVRLLPIRLSGFAGGGFGPTDSGRPRADVAMYGGQILFGEALIRPVLTFIVWDWGEYGASVDPELLGPPSGDGMSFQLGAEYVFGRLGRAVVAVAGAEVGLLRWEEAQRTKYPLTGGLRGGLVWRASRMLRIHLNARYQAQHLYAGLDPFATIDLGFGVCLPHVSCG